MQEPGNRTEKQLELQGILRKLEGHGLGVKQVAELLSMQGTMIPVTLYTDRKVGIMELTVRFLKEKGYHYCDIARLLNRDQRTVWVMHSQAMKKNPARLEPAPTSVYVPINIFRDRTHGTLKAIVIYLKEKEGLRFADIGRLLNRDPRIVCTVYHKR